MNQMMKRRKFFGADQCYFYETKTNTQVLKLCNTRLYVRTESLYFLSQRKGVSNSNISVKNIRRFANAYEMTFVADEVVRDGFKLLFILVYVFGDNHARYRPVVFISRHILHSILCVREYFDVRK